MANGEAGASGALRDVWDLYQAMRGRAPESDADASRRRGLMSIAGLAPRARTVAAKKDIVLICWDWLAECRRRRAIDLLAIDLFNRRPSRVDHVTTHGGLSATEIEAMNAYVKERYGSEG